jgi:hypothetical protein
VPSLKHLKGNAVLKPLLTLACAAVANTALADSTLHAVKLSDIKWEACDPKNPADPCKISYVRGNAGKEENYGFVKIPKGYTFPPHWHINNEGADSYIDVKDKRP